MLPFFSSLSPFDVYPLSFSPAFTLFLLSHHNPAHHYVRIYSLTQVAEETPRSRGQDTKLGSNIVSQGKGRGHPIPPTPAPSPKCVISTTSLHTFLAWSAAAAAAKSLQSCPTLCDPTDGSPPGSAVPGFSRQEHWSGLPFSSPVHESEK